MNLKKLVWIFMSFVVSSVYAQSYQKINNGVNAHIGQMDVMISFYSPSIVRVLKSPEGIVYNKKSLSVIMEPGETDFSISERGNDVILMPKTEHTHPLRTA